MVFVSRAAYAFVNTLGVLLRLYLIAVSPNTILLNMEG